MKSKPKIIFFSPFLNEDSWFYRKFMEATKMSNKYRTKPVVIEAFQMTKERRWDNRDWPQWLHKAWNGEPSEGAFWCDPEDPNKLFCGTLEGVHGVTLGDFIIQGVRGELYPCKPDIFAETYSAVK